MFATSRLMAQSGSTAEVESSVSSIWETMLEAVPRVGIAVIVVAAGWLAGRLIRSMLRSYFKRNHTHSFAHVMSKLAGWIVTGVGMLFGITVIFPSVDVVDLLAGFGLFSVAIGFAFQDILENLLAGVLLLLREPFHSGDQVEVNGHLGTVEEITIRETRIKTFDGRRILVPNADVYKNAIVVQTAFDQRRMAFVVGVAYEADLAEARTVIEDAMGEVDGVGADPSPEAFITELGAATVNFEARFWCDAPQHDALAAQDRVIENVKRALDDADIEMPADIVALQATSSFAAAIQGGTVTPGGGVDEAPDDHTSATTADSESVAASA